MLDQVVLLKNPSQSLPQSLLEAVVDPPLGLLDQLLNGLLHLGTVHLEEGIVYPLRHGLQELLVPTQEGKVVPVIVRYLVRPVQEKNNVLLHLFLVEDLELFEEMKGLTGFLVVC